MFELLHCCCVERVMGRVAKKGSKGGNKTPLRSSLRLRINLKSQHALLHIQNASNQIPGVSTPDGPFSQPQAITNPPVAENACYPRNRKITRCINSKQDATTEGSHVPCLNQSDPVALQGNRNDKGKQLAGKRTRNDEPSLLGSLVDSMEEEPTTLIPDESNLLSKNSSSSLLQTQPQDGGSMTPIAHCSSLPHTGNEKSGRLIEKFLKMRSILEKDSNMLELLVTPIQYDAQDDGTKVCVKSEPICIDLEDDAVYIVGKAYEFTLEKIMSAHGDIAQNCLYSLDIRTRLLETVCKIYKKLEASNIFEIDVSEMSRILQTLDQLHHSKLEVKWLIDRVLQSIEFTEELPRILTIRNIAKRKSSRIEDRATMLEAYKSQLEFHEVKCELLKEMIKEGGEELASEKQLTEVLNIFSESRAKKIKSLWEPLAHDLL